MIPRFLYKYQPLDQTSIENLKNHQIWFGKPIHLNDPYDCALTPGISDLSNDEFDAIYSRFRSESDYRILDTKYKKDGKLTEEFKQGVIRGAKRTFEDYKLKLLNERGIACFSELNADLLMWSHYADKHQGFCLEFETSTDPFQKARQVNYSNIIPSINPFSIANRQDDAFFAMTLTKASCWSYEKEWRIFHKVGETSYIYPLQSLTGVYFGLRMKQESKLEIIGILGNTKTEFYDMSKSENEFILIPRKLYMANKGD